MIYPPYSCRISLSPCVDASFSTMMLITATLVSTAIPPFLVDHKKNCRTSGYGKHIASMQMHCSRSFHFRAGLLVSGTVQTLFGQRGDYITAAWFCQSRFRFFRKSRFLHSGTDVRKRSSRAVRARTAREPRIAGQRTATPFSSTPSSALMRRYLTPPISRMVTRSERSGATLTTTSGVLYSS